MVTFAEIKTYDIPDAYRDFIGLNRGFINFPPELFWSVSYCLGEVLKLPQIQNDNRTGACILIARLNSENPIHILQAGEIDEKKKLNI